MPADQLSADEIFAEALRRSEGSERANYLDEVLGDDAAARHRIQRLLRAYVDAYSFLETPAEDPLGKVLREPPIGEGPGTVIGPYKLVEQIGEGGMGVVFLAEQERPVKRRVALKIIKPGMDTRQVIARFEAERQALAMMDHPNIAKVLDAGTTGEGNRIQGAGDREEGTALSLSPVPRPLSPHVGRPYFVMELVQGVPITDYCDQCNLPTRERLELFVTVCQAVQHAHQKGVIHRDIKPNNVLVQGTGSFFAGSVAERWTGTYCSADSAKGASPQAKKVPVPLPTNEKPLVKIIDFGVAKAIGQRLTEHTLMTAFAQMVGTPLYMSPEQAELSPLGVDTRSDIYSLGVLLYELLTGSTPLDKERLHAASYDELRRIIREEEPPRPSARISTLAADLATTVAEHRRTDARRLRQTVRGELDWIVMKCLEKDRNRRYETPNSLVRDIERYLSNEPVQACPPSTVYRLRKYVRRNKIALAFAVLLVGGLAYLAYSNLVIQSALNQKNDALALALSNEQRATQEARRAQATSDFLSEMLGSSYPDRIKDSRYTVREQLDDFSAGLSNEFNDHPEVEAAIQSVIGRSYWRLGVFDRADVHLRRALDLHRQVYGADDKRVADSLVDYAWNLGDQARFAEVETRAREAVSICGRLQSKPQETGTLADARYLLAITQLHLGDRAGYRETCNALVDLQVRTTDVVKNSRPIWPLCLAPDALDDMSRLVKRAEKYVAENSRSMPHFSLYVMGAAQYRAANFEQAAQRLKESIKTYPDIPEPGCDTINYQQLLLAMSKWQLGQQHEARRLLAEAQVAIEKELQDPSTRWNRRTSLELLHAEAEALIDPKDAGDEAKDERLNSKL